MQRLFRYALGRCAAPFLAVGLSFVLAFGLLAAETAHRETTPLPGSDLPGFDYSILKDVTLDVCQTSCEDDRVCRAFTYNSQSSWCFLKGEAGPQTPFATAVSGLVTQTPSPEAIADARRNELPFPGSDLVDAAHWFAAGMASTNPPPSGMSYAALVAGGDRAAARSNPGGVAVVSYQQALAINDNDPAVWLKLAKAMLARIETSQLNEYRLAVNATSAALNAFLASETLAERAGALGVLADTLAGRQMWRRSIATYRASLALIDDVALQGRLDAVIAEHGFRVVSTEIDAEAASPRVCAVFSYPLPAGDAGLSDYVVVDNAPRVAVESERNQICIEGVEHGSRYQIKLRAGLPSADGESLRADVNLDVYVPDRSPFVGFANNAYVLPAGLGGGLPINSINAEVADVVIYRIGDRSMAAAVRDGIFQKTLTGSSARRIADRYGEKSWEGQLDLSRTAANVMSVTAIPVAQVLNDMQPGAYVITAKVAGSEQDYWSRIATQWFIVTDLALSAVSGDDGVHVFVRSLSSAEPVANARVRLVARNNEILGETTTGGDGRADFAPGLSRGTGGRELQLLLAETEAGDYVFLDMSKPAFDLSERGVAGRPAPGPLDLFATTERGVYRPGETVFLTALLRDAGAAALTGLPLTVELERPDGVVNRRQVLADQGAGGYFAAIPLAADAMRGSWNIRLYVDPNVPPLASATFLVEDFEPERLALEIGAAPGPIRSGGVTPVKVSAKYLYGASAPGLPVEADVVVRPTTSLADYPGYVFGRLDDPTQTDLIPLGIVATSDANGNATAKLALPEAAPTTRPLTARIIVRLRDTNGRVIERSLTRPVLANNELIGIKPAFGDANAPARGAKAEFEIITVAPNGKTVASSALGWSLSRLETNYQWYRQNGVWKWEAITTSRQVANGVVDTIADGAVSVSAQLDWGRYRIEVESAGANPAATSYEFYAGYYYADAGSNTPDTLRVALDKPAYRAGDTANLRLDPQFAGTALVMVLDDGIIDMVAVPVPAEGTSVALKVSEEWGPGTYVTATLYRPAGVAEQRMPARALGLVFADVDPGARMLDVGLEVPAQSRPRQPLTATVKLNNVEPGQPAYVTVAAVDLGVLNLTGFAVPDPDGWFFGQRQLAMELRDLYGRLIDPTRGSPGALRSGGDEAAPERPGTPPATSVLVALHSGIVKVNADGTAAVDFDMPDFSGTVRIMVMAWTAGAVGHNSADVIVRDPVVVTLSPPRFLRLDDRSRLLVEINNIAGPAGAYRVELVTDEGLSSDAAETVFELAAGARTSLSLGLIGTAIGDSELKVIVTGPGGTVMVKELSLGVRAAASPVSASTLAVIKPGATLSLDASRFSGLMPNSGSLTLAVGSVARLNVPELLLRLDRYPYGCAEQITSRALPLLYLNEVAHTIGLGDDDAVDQRIREAIANLLAKQNSSGAFGLWGPFSYTDLWLDSYVTEFLLRARSEGYEVPEQALSRALDNLGNQLSYAADFTDGGQDVAYALYDLARAGRAAIGDLRYYYGARLDAFGSPLAKAQLGAALALYGDRTRAGLAFEAAIAGLEAPDGEDFRSDYGSRLRDTAAILALAAEFSPAGIDIGSLTATLASLRQRTTYSSTQEDAWTLVAAASLVRDAGDGSVSINGASLTGAVYRRYYQEQIEAAPVVIVNNANRPVEVMISVTGVPIAPPPASSQGFSLKREYFLVDGTRFDPKLSLIEQNQRFVVVLSAEAEALGSGQFVIDDPLPAGFEIENPDLSIGAGVSDLSWLGVTTPLYVQARTDRYVAAFRFMSNPGGFATAYLVRAVSPGFFVLPGASVQDMYRTGLRANTEAGEIEVRATGL